MYLLWCLILTDDIKTFLKINLIIYKMGLRNSLVHVEAPSIEGQDSTAYNVDYDDL